MKTPKENHSRENIIEETTTGKVYLLLSGTPFWKISDKEMQGLMKRYGLEKLLQAADIAAETWRRNGEKKSNPGGYLHSLCSSLVVPDWYVPFAERTALAQASQERKVAVEAAEAALKSQEEAQVMARNTLWESLSEDQREDYCSVALAALPPGLAPSMAVTAMAKKLAWEAKLSSNHD